MELSNRRNAAIYCRVSTDNQENEGTSLDTQRQGCLKYCQDKGYSVTHQFVETWSGLSLERPKLDELRQLVRGNQIDNIVIHSLDRLSRDPIHGVIITQELEKHHVTLEAVTEDMDNTEVGKLISYIRGFASKLETEKIKERTTRGIRARVYNKGLPVTFKAPYGYTWDKESKRLTPNDNYDTAKQIITWSIDGKSYDWIISELKRLAIPRPSGPGSDGDITWNKHTISTIIRNPVYAGRYYAFKSEAREPKKRNGGTYGKSSVTRLPQAQWHHIPEIEVMNPIITLAQRTLLLNKLEKRQKLSSRNAKRNYLLRGFIVCETHKGKGGNPRRYHGQPHHESYRYTCPVGGCDLSYLPGPFVDKLAKALVTNLIMTYTPDNFYKTLFESEKQRDFTAEQKQLEIEYEKVTNKMARLEDSNIDGKVDPEAYQRLKAQYTTQRQGIKDRQNATLDEMALLARKKEANQSWMRLTAQNKEAILTWLQLTDRFEKRLRGGPSGLNIEQYEVILRADPSLMYKVYDIADIEDIRGEWRKKFPEMTEAEITENILTVLREHPDEKAIKEGARKVWEYEKTTDWPEPLTDNEWRELFAACNFRWTILEQDNKQAKSFKGNDIADKILRRTNIYFDLPIASPETISSIALHGLGRD